MQSPGPTREEEAGPGDGGSLLRHSGRSRQSGCPGATAAVRCLLCISGQSWATELETYTLKDSCWATWGDTTRKGLGFQDLRGQQTVDIFSVPPCLKAGTLEEKGHQQKWTFGLISVSKVCLIQKSPHWIPLIKKWRHLGSSVLPITIESKCLQMAQESGFKSPQLFSYGPKTRKHWPK